jgi:hypothetical protein
MYFRSGDYEQNILDMNRTCFRYGDYEQNRTYWDLHISLCNLVRMVTLYMNGQPLASPMKFLNNKD